MLCIKVYWIWGYYGLDILKYYNFFLLYRYLKWYIVWLVLNNVIYWNFGWFIWIKDFYWKLEIYFFLKWYIIFFKKCKIFKLKSCFFIVYGKKIFVWKNICIRFNKIMY